MSTLNLSYAGFGNTENFSIVTFLLLVLNGILYIESETALHPLISVISTL